MGTRRSFLASLGKRPQLLLSRGAPKEPETDSPPPNASSQVRLRVLLLLITAIGLWLGLLRSNPESALLAVATVGAVLVELYRGPNTLWSGRLALVATCLEGVGGALAGALLGGIAGFVLAVTVPWNPLDFWATVRSGLALGALVGILRPRVAFAFAQLIPTGG